jgi:anti-sigma regulatory factor (Ser/Thr protein kinase)/anti-anti-sigma regulatory factor
VGSAVIDEAADGVRVESTVLPDHASGVIVVVLYGDLTLESVPTVRSVLLKCFAEFPEVVVVDVSELRTDTGSQLTVFPATVRSHAAPVTRLVLCGASPGLAALIDRRRFRDIPLYDTRESALSAVHAAQVQPRRRTGAHLAATPAAPGTARELVGDACRSWGVTHLTGSACVVISELVSNAVEHAGTDLTVTVALRGRYLHLSVQDGSTRPAVQADAAEGGPLVPVRGRGLQLVARYATAWGSAPVPGGKTVWATLRAGDG